MSLHRMGYLQSCVQQGLRWACLGLGALTAMAQAQSAIYRCGNEYTNSPTPAQKKECKLIEGSGVTVVPAAAVRAGASKPAPANDQQPRVDPQQQKARDNDARTILEAELKKAEGKLAALQQEYNNGQPEKRGEELRNVARYQERVSELKASIVRAEADVVGLRRELQRMGTASR
ncbi:hypothetical protein [Hydrogenophaga soli]